MKKSNDLAWFGVRSDGRPILERVKNNPCWKCNGFGTSGNPLCGAVYTCDHCKGTGRNPNITQMTGPYREVPNSPIVKKSIWCKLGLHRYVEVDRYRLSYPETTVIVRQCSRDCGKVSKRLIKQ